MKSLHEACETYKSIVRRRGTSEILLAPNGPDWTLPRIDIREHQRVAEQLNSETSRKWGLQTCCLLVRGSRSTDRTAGAKYAVMEAVLQNGKAPTGTYWMPRTVSAGRGVAEEGEAIKESLAELDSYARGEKTGPFARPGWLRDLFRLDLTSGKARRHPLLVNATFVVVNRRARKPSPDTGNAVCEQPLYLILKRDGSYL